jgi:cell division septation protein DedD
MIGGRRERDPLSEDMAALDDLQAEARRPVRRPTALIVPILITMIVMTGGVTIAWYSYNAGVKEGSEGAAPLLKPSGPMKVAPDSPGGTPIPHKDITVYQSLSDEREERKVERILPPPERPMVPPVAAPAPEAAPSENSRVRSADTVPGGAPTAEPPTAGPASPALGAPSARSLIPQSSPPASREPQVALNTPAEKKPADRKPVEAKPAAKDVRTAPVKPAPAPETKVAAIPTGAYKVQIGSVSSEDQAPRMWSIQRDKSAGLLASLSMNVEKTVIKGKAYYRVQAGPLKDAASARNLCDQLKQHQIGCFVVHPKK